MRNMTIMGKVIISIPLVTWRDGRPRFFPGPTTRELGYLGEDLRHPDDRWFTLEECIGWSQQRQQEIASRRAAIEAGRTTQRKTRNALERARRDGLSTVGQIAKEFCASPRMSGKAIVEGRKKRQPLSQNTIKFYTGASRLLEKFDDGRVWNAPAVELTGRALGGILHKVEVKHGLAQARAIRAFISVAFAFGRKLGLVGHNPVKSLEETLPVLEPRLRPASAGEIGMLIATADALGLPDFGDVVAAGTWTGQRQNDRLALPASALTADGIVFAPSKKARSRQRLLIPVAKILSARLEAARKRRAAWTVQTMTLLVCEGTGRPWEADWYRKVFRVVRHAAAFATAEMDEAGAITKDARAILGDRDVPALLKAAGIAPCPSVADLRDQDLRDTCLSWLALAGADKFEIAGFSGHAFGQDDKVLRHYVAIPPEFARRGMSKLEAWHANQNSSRTSSHTV